MISVVIAGDIRQFHEDSSSEDTSPSDHKNTRSRSHGGDRWVTCQGSPSIVLTVDHFAFSETSLHLGELLGILFLTGDGSSRSSSSTRKSSSCWY